MKNQRTLLVGFDLGDDYSQISCYNTKTKEPESVRYRPEEDKYLIPGVVGVKKDTREWIFGEDALVLEQEGKGAIVDSLLECIRKEEAVSLFGVSISPVKLLEKYLRKCLQLLKLYYPAESIRELVVTVKDQDEKTEQAVYAALESLGIGKDRTLVQSHMDSFLYYALSQPEELWTQDVGLFELDEEGLTYHQITINRNVRPYLVEVIHKDFASALTYDMVKGGIDGEKPEYLFGNLANTVLYKQAVSTVYVTGEGFEGDWADSVLKGLCRGRRIFKGQNLYTKGACYAARELAGEQEEEGLLDKFLFLSPDMVMSEFKVKGYYDAKPAEVLLVKAPSLWHEIDESADFILDDEQVIPVLITDIIKKESRIVEILLNGLPNRPNKGTRVRIRVKFLDRRTAVITVKDLGFGEIFPSTNRIWEKEVEIN